MVFCLSIFLVINEEDCCSHLQALEFASMQNDDEIWEELIKQSTQRPEMVCLCCILKTMSTDAFMMKIVFSILSHSSFFLFSGWDVAGAHCWQP